MKKLFLSLACASALLSPLHAETDLLELKASEVKNLQMMSNNHAPKTVIVVRNRSTAGFVDNLIQTLKKINQEDNAGIRLHVIVDSSWSASSFKQQLQSQDLLGSLVEVNEEFYTSDQWMQDWGEILVAELQDGQRVQAIFDSNRGRGLQGLAKVFARMWNARYTKNPSNAGIKGDYGGNIEVTPDNVLVLGTTSTQQLRSFFAERGYADKMALLDTDWLQVGHVDEYISFIPDASAPNGYSIVKADPSLALDTIRDASDTELNQVLSDYRSQIKAMHEALQSEGMTRGSLGDYDLSEGNPLADAATRNNDSRMNQLVDLNREIASLIDANVERLKAKITEATGGEHSEFSVISFPTLFKGSKYGGSLSRCVALLPGTVNMLVLGQHAVIPDAQFPMFNDLIRKATEGKAIKPHFLENLAYHYYAGQIHCGTNVVRDPAHYVVKPELILRWKERQARLARFRELISR